MTAPETCVHCGEHLKPTSVGGLHLHASGLGRCQSADVPYGHMGHPSMPCPAGDINPCLGYREAKDGRWSCTHLAPVTAPDDAVGARLGAMRERSAAATAGPWAVFAALAPDGRRYNGIGAQGRSGDTEDDYEVCDISRTPQGSEDAEFIAHARTDLDDLLAAVEDVLALHTSDGHKPDDCGQVDCWEGCAWCCEPWPCATVAAITKRLGPTP